MDIYPEDFEPDYYARIQEVRSLLNGGPIGRSQYSFLGAMCGMAPAMFLNTWLHIIPDAAGSFFLTGGVGAALGYLCGLFAGRRAHRSQQAKKVTVQEINFISKSGADPLRVQYLDLISKLILMRSLQDISVEDNIRRAIKDIGFGITKLPKQPADDLLLDALTFQEEAARLAQEAAQESDLVVAASLQRQAAAQSQRAEAVSRNSSLARRNQILRQEMTEHIKSLTTMLSAADLGDNNSEYDLTALAENIQQVAIEAKSLTEAKQELVAALEEGQPVRLSIQG